MGLRSLSSYSLVMHPVIVLDVFDSSILTTVDKRIMRTEARGRRASIPKVRAFRSAWACQPKDVSHRNSVDYVV